MLQSQYTESRNAFSDQKLTQTLSNAAAVRHFEQRGAVCASTPFARDALQNLRYARRGFCRASLSADFVVVLANRYPECRAYLKHVVAQRPMAMLDCDAVDEIQGEIVERERAERFSQARYEEKLREQVTGPKKGGLIYIFTVIVTPLRQRTMLFIFREALFMFQASKFGFVAFTLFFATALPSNAWACASTKTQSLKTFEACLKDMCSDSCTEIFDPYFAKNPDQAFAAGKLVRLHIHPTKALPYFATAIKRQPSEAGARCKDPDVVQAIDAGLHLPSSEKNAEIARKLLAGECASSMVPVVQKAMEADGANRYLKANACPVLISKNSAPSVCRGAEDHQATSSK